MLVKCHWKFSCFVQIGAGKAVLSLWARMKWHACTVKPSDILKVKNASPSLCVTSRFMIHKNNRRMWRNISSILVAWWQTMWDVNVKLNPVLPWRNQHSTRKLLSSVDLHPCIISQLNPTRCTILFNIFIYFSSLHVSGIYVPIIRRKLLYPCVTGETPTSRPDATHTVWQVPVTHGYSNFLLMMGT